jgi:hypothetical protein
MSAPTRYSKESSSEYRLNRLKGNLVLQLVTRRGDFWTAIEKVRSRWQIADPPAALPPESDDVLLPSIVGETTDSGEEYTAYLNAKSRWFGDLRLTLLEGRVAERYIEESPPYVGNPPLPKRSLHWCRFAAACVLYGVPRSEHLPAFASYGGPPAVPRSARAETANPALLTERQLRQQEIAAEEQQTLDKMVSKKMWELRSELDDLDYARARLECGPFIGHLPRTPRVRRSVIGARACGH